MPTTEDIRKKLTEVLDPELFLSIVDLGPVYDIQIEDKTAIITMTLTTIGCPLFDTIQNDINKAVLSLPDIDEVKVELTFDPPWDYSIMSESARAELGIE